MPAHSQTHAHTRAHARARVCTDAGAPWAALLKATGQGLRQLAVFKGASAVSAGQEGPSGTEYAAVATVQGQDKGRCGRARMCACMCMHVRVSVCVCWCACMRAYACLYVHAHACLARAWPGPLHACADRDCAPSSCRLPSLARSAQGSPPKCRAAQIQPPACACTHQNEHTSAHAVLGTRAGAHSGLPALLLVCVRESGREHAAHASPHRLQARSA